MDGSRMCETPWNEITLAQNGSGGSHTLPLVTIQPLSKHPFPSKKPAWQWGFGGHSTERRWWKHFCLDLTQIAAPKRAGCKSMREMPKNDIWCFAHKKWSSSPRFFSPGKLQPSSDPWKPSNHESQLSPNWSHHWGSPTYESTHQVMWNGDLSWNASVWYGCLGAFFVAEQVEPTKIMNMKYCLVRGILNDWLKLNDI